MSLLKWNQRKVQNLTPLEIWMFILARVFIGFGMGVLAMQYFPGVAARLAIPAIVIGFLLFILAARGLIRKFAPAN